jgi:hypothetical protein
LVEFAGHIKQMMRMLSPVLRVPVLRVPVLLLFIALLWHNQALSETTIDLGNGSALSFQSGSLSQDYSTADLTGITLTENGTTLLTAGRFQFSSFMQKGTAVIKDGIATTVRFENDDAIIIVGAVQASHLPLSDETIILANVAVQHPLLLNAQDTVIHMKQEPFISIAVGNFELDGGTGLINKPPQTTTFSVSEIGITSQKNPAFTMALSALGLQELSLDMTGSAQKTAHNQLVFLESDFHLNIAGLGRIRHSSQVSGSEDMINIIIEQQQSQTGQITDISGDEWKNIALNKAEFEITDTGILSALETTGQVMPLDQLADGLSGIASLFMPKNGGRVTAPIRQFLLQGGSLLVSLHPQIAPQFGSFSSLSNNPDGLVDRLGIDVTHLP